MLPRPALLTAGLLALLLCTPARAQAPARPDPLLWALCEPDDLAYLVTADSGVEEEDAAVDFTADTVDSSPTRTTLEGNVQVRRGDQRLTAPKVSLDRTINRIEAGQGAEYGDPRLAVRAERGEVDLDTEIGRFWDAQYYVPTRNAQGSAERVVTNQDTGRSRLTNPTFSTCKRGDEFWVLRTRRLDVDQVKGRAVTRHTTLHLFDVPVLYWPYLSFPINDERQSGFLTPRLGFDSDRGFDFQVPYYWNIAPNYDLTFAPRFMTQRGVLLGNEFRFLFPTHSGEIDLEYLHDLEDDRDRGAVFLSHESRPLPRLRTDLLGQVVSDDDYIEDFGNNLGLLNDTHLESHLDAFYIADHWTALARAQAFQVIDDELFDDEPPYDRLPQLEFAGAWPDQPFGLTYDLHSEVVYFRRDSEVPRFDVDGARLDVEPAISLPLEWPAGFIIPRAAFRYTAYKLTSTEAGRSDESPDRAAPVLSVDSGLFFERPVELFGEDGIHTLE
ncbi:MAG: LPS assembly protein LptD, partial [Pseudomonadota bacterium]|nr:LPS assembly protein LptD [Pseudomonadota bacterium]